jgi:choline kinase
VLANATAPVTVTIDRNDAYDADDMKVRVDGETLGAIGKWLPASEANGESIGMMLFRDGGPALFKQELERIMRTPEGLDYWYTSVIDILAKRGVVGAVSIQGMGWGEIDFPVDLQRARALVARWTAAEAERESAGTPRL